jgi:hypothetical protein
MSDMQTPRFAATDPQWVGLAWYMRDVNGTNVFGHGGGTNGQLTLLQIAPARNLAFAILTNGDQGTTLHNNVANTILETYLDIPPVVITPFEPGAAELASYAGRYEAPLDDVEITVHDSGLRLQVTDKGGFPVPSSPPSLTQPPPVRAALYAPDKLFARDDPFQDARGEFLRNARGDIEWLRIFGRIHKRVEST